MEYLKINKWTISVPVWSRMKSLWATSESLTSCAPRWSTPGWATRSARTCSTPNCRPWSTTPYNSRAWSRCAVFTLVSNSKVSSFFFFFLYISLGSLIYNHRAAHWWADFAASFCWGVSESIDYIRDGQQKRKLCGKRYVTKCRRGETASCHITAEPVHYVKSRTLLLIRAGAARVPANLSDDGAAFIHHTRAASEHNERQKKKKIKGGNKQLSHHSATDSGGRIKKKHCKAFCLLSYYYSFPFLDCVFFSPRAPSIVSPSQQQPQQQTRNKRRKKTGRARSGRLRQQWGYSLIQDWPQSSSLFTKLTVWNEEERRNEWIIRIQTTTQDLVFALFECCFPQWTSIHPLLAHQILSRAEWIYA